MNKGLPTNTGSAKTALRSNLGQAGQHVPTAPADAPGTSGSQPPDSTKDTFIGEGITPDDLSFAAAPMATGQPGLPQSFSWRGRKFSVLEVLEQWKESGDCHHGPGERYVRKHWFRVRTTEALEMRIYFERQQRSSGGSRWRLYSLRNPTVTPCHQTQSPSAT